MPSDSKKKKEQQKKEARKKKDIKKPANSANDVEQLEEDDQDDQDQNNEEETTSTTTTNGTNGTPTNGATTAKPARNPFDMAEIKKHLDEVLQVEKMNAENRACTGVLASHPNGRDTQIHQFSLTFYGQELVVSPNYISLFFC
jgi:hypothetical protein